MSDAASHDLHTPHGVSLLPRDLTADELFLSVVTVAELRYGAIVADWGSPRRERVEATISATTGGFSEVRGPSICGARSVRPG